MRKLSIRNVVGIFEHRTSNIWSSTPNVIQISQWSKFSISGVENRLLFARNWKITEKDLATIKNLLFLDDIDLSVSLMTYS